MSECKLSIVVPCYNEESGLHALHRRLTLVAEACVGRSYELIFVNDGSKDATWRVMQTLSAADPHLVAVNLSRNYGHQLALTAGLKMTRGARIFILDADLQDPPELLPAMMARIDDGCDVVYGQRVKRNGESYFKKATAYTFYRLLDRLTEINVPEDAGDFRLMSRRAVDVLNSMPENNRFIRGMVGWIGLRQEAMPYERAARTTGTTSYPLSKMLRLAIDAITGFSVRPLRLAFYTGVLSSIATVFMLFYVLISYFSGTTVQGWTSLMTIVLGIGSVQMLMLGIMGEYLGRLYMESKGRPLYVIQDVLASPEMASAFAPRTAELVQ